MAGSRVADRRIEVVRVVAGENDDALEPDKSGPRIVH